MHPYCLLAYTSKDLDDLIQGLFLIQQDRPLTFQGQFCFEDCKKNILQRNNLIKKMQQEKILKTKKNILILTSVFHSIDCCVASTSSENLLASFSSKSFAS